MSQEACLHDLKQSIGSWQAWNAGNPGEAAGITIEGNDKILTMIQAAAKSYDKSAD